MYNFFKHSRGFTLIELLVVILIIAILIAIASPAFIGQISKAQDSSSQQTLSVVRKDMKAAWTSEQGYPDDLLGEMRSNEPQYQMEAFDATDLASLTQGGVVVLEKGTVYVDRQSVNEAVACEQSKSSRVFCLKTTEDTAVTELVTASVSDDVAYAAGKTQTRKSTGATLQDALAALEPVVDLGSPTDSTKAGKGVGGTGVPSWSRVKVAENVVVPPTDNQQPGDLEALATIAQFADAITTYRNDNGELPNYDTYNQADGTVTAIDLDPWKALPQAPSQIKAIHAPGVYEELGSEEIGRSPVPTAYLQAAKDPTPACATQFTEQVSFYLNSKDGSTAYLASALDGVWSLVKTQRIEGGDNTIQAANDEGRYESVTWPGSLPSYNFNAGPACVPDVIDESSQSVMDANEAAKEEAIRLMISTIDSVNTKPSPAYPPVEPFVEDGAPGTAERDANNNAISAAVFADLKADPLNEGIHNVSLNAGPTINAFWGRNIGTGGKAFRVIGSNIPQGGICEMQYQTIVNSNGGSRAYMVFATITPGKTKKFNMKEFYLVNGQPVGISLSRARNLPADPRWGSVLSDRLTYDINCQ